MRGIEARLLVCALAFTLLAPTCDSRRTDSLRALQEGMQRYSEGRRTQALEKFREAVAIDDTNDLAHYYTGVLSFHQFKDRSEARKHLERAVSIDPAQAEYQYQYGAVLQSGGQVSEALPYLEAAIARDPEHAQAHYRLGMVHRAQGRLRQAAQVVMKAIELAPRFDRAYVELGDVYLSAGHPREAAQVFRNCTQNAPQRAECFNELGRALAAGGDRKGAIAAFNDALQRDPQLGGALFNVGIAYNEEGDLAMAKGYLERYLKTADRKSEPDRVAAAEQIVSGMMATQ